MIIIVNVVVIISRMKPYKSCFEMIKIGEFYEKTTFGYNFIVLVQANNKQDLNDTCKILGKSKSYVIYVGLFEIIIGF